MLYGSFYEDIQSHHLIQERMQGTSCYSQFEWIHSMILNTSACQALCQKLGLKKGLYFFAFEEHLMEKIGVSAEHHKLV